MADEQNERNERNELDRLGRGGRATVQRAIDEAGRRGAGTVEAEHFVLAVAASAPASPAARVLASAGLDYDGVVAALRAERTAALAVAGVEAVPEAQLAATARTGRPRWGRTSREALGRAAQSRARNHRRRMGEADVLVGIFSADFGTVPRALAIAGIDRDALIADLMRL